MLHCSSFERPFRISVSNPEEGRRLCCYICVLPVPWSMRTLLLAVQCHKGVKLVRHVIRLGGLAQHRHDGCLDAIQHLALQTLVDFRPCSPAKQGTKSWSQFASHLSGPLLTRRGLSLIKPIIRQVLLNLEENAVQRMVRRT